MILQTRLIKGNSCLGKFAIDITDTLNSSMLKKVAEDSKAKGKKHGFTPGLLGLLSGNGC